MTTTALEVADPPVFAVGDSVRAITSVRNDGTFGGKRIGEVLIDAGETGYVHSVGVYLQRHYIYDVDFFGRGIIVGMRAHELERVGETT